MSVFVVLIEDRHEDVDVELFGDGPAAVTRARAIAHGRAAHGQVVEEEITDSMREDGWRYCAGWSTESDCVRVIERALT